MTLDAEILVDRRRLKRRLSLWRLLAVVAVAAAVAALFLQNEWLATATGLKPQIARVTVSGIIRDDREQQMLLANVAKADHVKAVILRVNSPGGTATGGESLFAAIRELAEKKPVVAVFGTVATSSAYIVGLASDRIVARGNTITGSIGVILQWAEVSDLLKKLGVTVNEVRSGPLKAIPSPFQPLDETGRELTREMVEEAETWFIELVAKRRDVQPSDIPGLTEGRIYSGRQALSHKLIDQIGGETDAIAWLEQERQVPKDLKVVDWEKTQQDPFGIWNRLARGFARLTGADFAGALQTLGAVPALKRVQLDGLISLWHPAND